MLNRILCAAALMLGSSVHASDLRTSADIYRIIEQSPLKYTIVEFSETDASPSASSGGYDHGFYRETTPDGFLLMRYAYEGRVGKWWAEAERLFKAEKFKDARKNYAKLLKKMPRNSQVMTYLGQTFEAEKDLESAAEWYLKAAQNNPIDYMAHWFLADAYYSRGQFDKAFDSILHAHILNRNHEKIRESMERIAEANQLKMKTWAWNPKYALQKDGDDVLLKSALAWLPYAMCKAVWAFEPSADGHPATERQKSWTMEEELECLNCLASVYPEMEATAQKEPELMDALTTAADQDLISEFILYEIWLPKMPLVALNLPDESLDRIHHYIKTLRTISFIH